MRRWINGDMRKKMEKWGISKRRWQRVYKVKSKINTTSIVFLYSFNSSFSHLSCLSSVAFIISPLSINKKLGENMFEPSQTPKWHDDRSSAAPSNLFFKLMLRSSSNEAHRPSMEDPCSLCSLKKKIMHLYIGTLAFVMKVFYL